MARDAELRARITAQDDASKVIDKVADKADDLEKHPVNVKVDADTKGAEGALSKLKGAGGQAMSFIKDNAASLATGAAAAIGAFAVKAVGDFNDIAMGAGELRDKLGLAADEASRWQEVAGDLGVSNDTLVSTIGRMNKNLGATPGLFKDAGVEIAKTADGATDVSATFLNVIATLNAIEDPAERAAVGTKLLGKSWMEMSELITTGAPDITKRLEEVGAAKIVDDKKIGDARKYRDSMDDLQDTLEAVSITVGAELVPALSDAADTVLALVGPLQKVKGAFDDITNVPVIKQIYENFAPWQFIPTRIRQVSSAWDALFGTDDGQKGRIVESFAEEFNAALESTKPVTDQAIARQKAWIETLEASPNLAGRNAMLADAKKKLDEMTASTDKANKVVEIGADRAKNHQRALEGVTEAEEALKDATDAYVDSLNEQIDGMQNAADAGIAVEDALRDYNDTLHDSDATAQDVRDSAIDLAEAQVKLTEAQYKSLGATASATTKLDAQNESLLAAAATAKGPARQSILDYIGAVNQIPPEKITEIAAAIERGDLAEAQRLIDEASRARTVAIVADANTVQAENEIQQLIRTRNMTINANIVAKGGAGYGGVSGPSAGPRSVAPYAAAPYGVSTQATAGTVTLDVGIPSGADIARRIGKVKIPFYVASSLRADERISGARDL